MTSPKLFYIASDQLFFFQEPQRHRKAAINPIRWAINRSAVMVKGVHLAGSQRKPLPAVIETVPMAQIRGTLDPHNLTPILTVTLAAPYFEKFSMSILGFVSFTYLIPISLLAIGASVLVVRSKWGPGLLNVGKKVFALSLIPAFIIPTSVHFTKMIDDNHHAITVAEDEARAQFEAEEAAAEEAAKAAEEDVREQPGDASWLDNLPNPLDLIPSAVDNISNGAQNTSNSFGE